MAKEILLSVVFLLGVVLAEMPRDVVSQYDHPDAARMVPVAAVTVDDEAAVRTASRPARLATSASSM